VLRGLKKTDLSVPLSRSEQFAILVVGALDELSYFTCCPDCCAKCAVVSNLLVAGELDQVVANAPPETVEGSDWFKTGRVLRSWLYSRWDDPGQCTSGEALMSRQPGKACDEHRRLRKKCTCRQAELKALQAAAA
jgi:hypothetical protein